MPRSPSYVVRAYQGDREKAARLVAELGPFPTLTEAKKHAQVQADAAKRGVKVYVEPVGTEEVGPTHPRDNPAHHASRQEVLDLLASGELGAGAHLDSFAAVLRAGGPISPDVLRQAVADAEQRLEDAEYELRTDKIPEHRADNRQDRDHYRKVLAAIRRFAAHPHENPAHGMFCCASCAAQHRAAMASGRAKPPVRLNGRTVSWGQGSQEGQFCAHCSADLSQPRRNPEEEVQLLPDEPTRYFKMPPGSLLVPVSQLVPVRARVTGIANAAKYMRMAYDGQMERRKPISIAPRPDGLYTVCDGNSTFANAKRSGWKNIIALVTDQCPTEEAHHNPGNPSVSIHTPITEANYPAIFGETTRGLPEVDDPFGHAPGCNGTVGCGDQIEETRLSDQFRTILRTRDAYLPRMQHIMGMLRQLAPSAEVLGRVKTPYSLINKLVRSFLAQPDASGVGKFKTARGTATADMPLGVPLQLKDMAGTKIVAKDRAELDRVRDSMLAAFKGNILEYEDKYAEEDRAAAEHRPRLGYVAYHMVVLDKGLPVEIIMQTKRIEALGHASHAPYKNRTLDLSKYIELVDLVNRADKGDHAAARKIDPLLATHEGQHKIEQEITLRHVNPVVRWNPTDPDVIAEVTDRDGWAP